MKLCIISVIWVLWGYSLSFSSGSFNNIIGGFNFFGFNNVGYEAHIGTNIPHLLFAVFQGMFAVITVVIITGSFAERVKLGPVLIFGIIWLTFVYAPITHWVWGGGWVSQTIKSLDFAGGGVVHINSAIAGLVATVYIGKRKGFKYGDVSESHNISLTVIGASLLWFGWFGFNAGSALAANKIAVIALVNTNVAAASGAISWFLIEYFYKKKSTIIGVVSGSVAGLVAITPAAGYISPLSSIITGLIAGMLCYLAVFYLKPKLKYDDSLDVFGIHGVGGIWGSIATGIFSSSAINSAGIDGLIYGKFDLLKAQCLSSLIIISYSAVITLVILKLINSFASIRVNHAEEFDRLDTSQHGEKCYNINNQRN